MTFKLKVLSDTSVPIREQIRRQIELAIANGQLSPGQAIPSVRQLAISLKVNPKTVANSLQTLVIAGTLVSQKGKGYFVSHSNDRFSEAEKKRQLKDAAEKFVADTRSLGLEPSALIQAITILLDKE